MYVNTHTIQCSEKYFRLLELIGKISLDGFMRYKISMTYDVVFY